MASFSQFHFFLPLVVFTTFQLLTEILIGNYIYPHYIPPSFLMFYYFFIPTRVSPPSLPPFLPTSLKPTPSEEWILLRKVNASLAQ